VLSGHNGTTCLLRMTGVDPAVTSREGKNLAMIAGKCEPSIQCNPSRQPLPPLFIQSQRRSSAGRCFLTRKKPDGRMKNAPVLHRGVFPMFWFGLSAGRNKRPCASGLAHGRIVVYSKLPIRWVVAAVPFEPVVYLKLPMVWVV